MNRAELIETFLAAKKVMETAKAMLNERGAAEYVDERVAPSWRSTSGGLATANLTTAGPYVSDEAALLGYVRAVHPSEIETLERIRPKFLETLLADTQRRGDPPQDAEGTVIPGLGWRPGGEFSHMSVTTTTPMRARLAELAATVRQGTSPLALPSEVDGA